MLVTLKKELINHWEVFLLFFLVILTAWPLFAPGYFSHHDDLQVMRIFEMRKCLIDLQIPCRWVPDLGYGNGFPLFNFYNPLPYYIGAKLSFVFGYILSAKILFLIPLIAAPFGMYFFIKDLWGKIPGVTAAVLFMFAPYRALDLYVRGAVAESFAVAIVPFIFYFLLKLIKENSYKNFLFFSLSIAALLTSHNIMTMLFLPWILIWAVFWVIYQRRNIVPVTLGFLAGIGLSAFFTFPAFIEKDLVETDSLRIGDLNFRAHFVTIKQIFFDRFWGYGASTPGSNDTISFQIGWPLWFFVPFSFLGLVFLWVKRKKELIKETFIALFALSLFSFSVFMMHNKSAFIWEFSDTLQFTQFPWRFLALSVFSASILGGFFVNLFNKKISIFVFLIICLSSILLNWNYFKPARVYNLSDQEKLTGKLWEEQQKAAILDYLPKTAFEPSEKAPDKPQVIFGNAKISNFLNNSNNFSFRVKAEKKSDIEIPVFDFPNWTVYENGKEISHRNNNLLGRIEVSLPKGEYEIKGVFENTLIRIFGNTMTILTIIILILLGFYRKKFLWKK